MLAVCASSVPVSGYENGRWLGMLTDDKNVLHSAGLSLDSPVRPVDKNEKCPRVEKLFYDTNGKVNGVAIVVAEGDLSVTGEQFAEWYRQKFPR